MLMKSIVAEATSSDSIEHDVTRFGTNDCDQTCQCEACEYPGMTTPHNKSLVIIGGGPAGLMAAETAARGAEAWIWNLANNSAKLNCGYNGGDVGFCYTPQTANDGSGGTMYVSNPLVQAFRTTPTWIANASSGGTDYSNSGNTALNSSSLGTAKLAQVPQYMIESLGGLLPPGVKPNFVQLGAVGRDPGFSNCAGCQSLYSFRITARATGGNEGAVSVVESTFGASVPSN